MAKFTQFALPFHLEVIQRHRSNIERVGSFPLSPHAYPQSSVTKWIGTGTHVGINGLGSIGLLGANLQEKNKEPSIAGVSAADAHWQRAVKEDSPSRPRRGGGEIGQRERWKIYDKGKKEWQERKEKGWRVRGKKPSCALLDRNFFVNGEIPFGV